MIVHHVPNLDISQRIGLGSCRLGIKHGIPVQVGMFLVLEVGKCKNRKPLVTGGDRKSYLQRALQSYNQFLRLLDTYDILSKSEAAHFEQFKTDPKNFSTAPINDATKGREVKITRFKAEKELKQKLQVCSV